MNKVTEYRREFHKYPEKGWRELRTSARIGEILTGLGYTCLMGDEVVDMSKVVSFALPSKEELEECKARALAQGANPVFLDRTGGIPGVIAQLDTGTEGPVTAFRFDIDCLPYDEPQKSGFRPFDEGFISCNPNSVHACGHDAHTAIGLGIAEAILPLKNMLKGKIILIFQPAEETFGGALSIVSKGHLDSATHFIALHVAVSADNKPMPSKAMCCGCKDFLSDRQLDVYFTGTAAHPCGASQDGRNAILAACAATVAIHSLAPHEEGLTRVNVGEISGGVAPNTIAPNAKIVLEYRGETPAISEYLGKRIFEILDGVALSYGVKYRVDDYGEVPAGKSDDAMMEIIGRAARKVKWFEQIYFEGNVGGTDDAAAMMNKVQGNGGIGTYLGIGTDVTMPVHNAEFDLDEACLEPAVDLCVEALKEIHGK